MKQKNSLIKLILLTIFTTALLLTTFSCASGPATIEFTVLEPAEIDMSRYRNIVVPSTTSYRGWNYGQSNIYIPFSRGTWNDYNFHLLPYSSYYTPLPEAIAEYSNTKLVNALQKTNYFNNIVYGREADNIYNVLSVTGVSYDNVIAANKIDAFIKSEISKMYSNEYLDAEPVYEYEKYIDKYGVERTRRILDHYNFTLYQKVSVAITYSVIDARTRAVIATRTVEDSTTRSTWISPYTRYAPSFLPYFQNLLDGLNNSVLKSLAPHKRWVEEELMDNDPKLEAYDDAWELVDNESFELARSRFLDAWNRNRHIPSGYNAAILSYSQGDYDTAISILGAIYDETHNVKVGTKLNDVKALKDMSDRAKKQL